MHNPTHLTPYYNGMHAAFNRTKHHTAASAASDLSYHITQLFFWRDSFRFWSGFGRSIVTPSPDHAQKALRFFNEHLRAARFHRGVLYEHID